MRSRDDRWSALAILTALLGAIAPSTVGCAHAAEAVRTYSIPVTGIMGLDFDAALAAEIARDIAESKPGLIVVEVDAAGDAAADGLPAIDTRREVSVLAELRDAVQLIRVAAGAVPVAVLVRDGMGVESFVALSWPRVFMVPGARIGAPAAVGSPRSANEADIRAEMRAVAIGIGAGMIQGAHTPAQFEALLAAGADGMDISRAIAAGVCNGEAADRQVVVQTCGFSEVLPVGNGAMIVGRASAEWRNGLKVASDLLRKFQAPVENVDELGERRQQLEKVRTLMSTSSRLSRAIEWSIGLTDERAAELLGAIDAQFRVVPAWVEVKGLEGERFVRLPASGHLGDVVTARAVDAAGRLADVSGPGQIVVIELDSPGGLMTEVFAILESIKRLRERHRVVIWIREALGGAAAVALAGDEIIFRSVGSLGAPIMVAGAPSVYGRPLETFQDEIGSMIERPRRPRMVFDAIVRAKAVLTYTKDPATGKVSWHDTITGQPGEVVLSDEKQSLVFTASTALDSGVSEGTADSVDDLARLLGLGVRKTSP